MWDSYGAQLTWLRVYNSSCGTCSCELNLTSTTSTSSVVSATWYWLVDGLATLVQLKLVIAVMVELKIERQIWHR